MLRIENYTNEQLTKLEDTISALLQKSIADNNNLEMVFWSDLYGALGIAKSRNINNGEG